MDIPELFTYKGLLNRAHQRLLFSPKIIETKYKLWPCSYIIYVPFQQLMK